MSTSQVKGLILKNYQLVTRQKGTLICQLITPILCLGFIALIKLIIETQIGKTNILLKVDLPVLFNMPFIKKFNYTNNLVRMKNCEEWYLYDFDKDATDEDKKFFGVNDGSYGNETSGILTYRDNIVQSKCNQVHKRSPYFIQNKNGTMNEYLYDTFDGLNKLSLDDLFNDTFIRPIPDGTVQIKKINDEVFDYKLQVNDNRIYVYHRSNGVTLTLVYNKATEKYGAVTNVINGVMWAADLFNKAYFRKFFKDVFITSSVQVMPLTNDDNDYIQRIINVTGSTFYPLAISLLMPLFMYTIVLEKEAKLIEIMKINGMKMRYYWTSNFIFNFCLYTITMILYNLFGSVILGLSFFTQTNWFLLILMYIGWGICQVGMAFFFQAFLTNPKTSTIVGYILSLWTTILAVSFNNTIFNSPKRVPTWLLFYPTFNICRIIYLLTMKCGYTQCLSSFSEIDSELGWCVGILYLSPWLYYILGIYLYEVIPQQYGVRKHPLFFLEFCKRRSSKVLDEKRRSLIEAEVQKERDSHINLDDDEIKSDLKIIEKLDDDERKSFPLVVEKLTKIYNTADGRKKLALDQFSLLLRNNEIFGLLGPNGAGKTTFFSLLTGMYEPTSGNAWVGRNSIVKNIELVQQQIGYCPQFDLLWSDLTVEEHLYFYSRLKNVNSADAVKNVEQSLKDVKLEKFKKFLVRELSGGMKRRLSLGISLVGGPQIIFLDEPTTGLDPENKRQIWEILSNCKSNKCMILTTHLMEEAEVLSDRIGIITNGTLKCLGSQFKLKRVYGKGFKLVVNLVNLDLLQQSSNIRSSLEKEEFSKKRVEDIKSFINSMFANATTVEAYKNTIVFEIPNDEFDAELLFNNIEDRKEEMTINNWAISQITLEDIFIRLTETDINS